MGDRVATIADFREQGALDARKCAGIFSELCIEASPARRMDPEDWLDVHYSEIVPKRLDTLHRLGATAEELVVYVSFLNTALKTELKRFHNIVGPIEGFRP
ncbi:MULTISPECIES: hypothetical protein [Bradyrhizobium]|uniref:hypothetical protein n=1 Tax=Bradyrhizobium TaxID=374 RepID=UPI0010086AA1|nr:MULTISPECIES: hypothetical protein [Bradyrhizobium]MDA9400914.1 hypothetical protein [Bradyrhizobium sp. CCBAU 45389]MDA9527304.1 hypothetical protein [Bradyrhizobium sp. CCBAU 25338]RXH33310.1 hypothetical protein XH84_10060 [Bradyrhizobium nanningense]